MAARVGSSALLLLACSPSAPSGARPVDDGGIGAESDASWGVSACGECVGSACATAIVACSSDPDCAAYLTCVQACGVSGSGDVDPGCEAACPRGVSTAGTQAEQRLSHCRTDGLGSLCVACGTSASAAQNPLLRQQCPRTATTDACKQCEEEHCCQTTAACDADCQGLTTCMINGGNYLDCQMMYPSGLVNAERQQTCNAIFCYRSDLCHHGLRTCNQCIYQECAEEYADIRGSLAGALYFECTAAGSDSATCLGLYPQATAVAEAYLVCVGVNCVDCSG